MGKNPYASLSQPNIISPSSSFKPKLSDQDYMELVCENGQIIAKSRRPNNGSFENLRTESILDLYETEYDEGFKKNIKNLGDSQVVPGSESQHPQQDEETDEQTSDSNNKKKIKPSKTESERDVWKRNKRFESSKLMNDSLKGLKNVEVITSPPDEQSAAVGRSKELYVASSSKFSRGTSRDLSCCYLKKRKYSDMEEEESTYLSNPVDAKTRVTATTRKTVAKKKRSTEGHKLSERKRRNEISRKMRELQDLLPNCYKDDNVSLLDEAIKYMRTLQLHVQMMSMGNGMIPSTSTMLPMGHYSPMGLGMHMCAAATTTSVPQCLPMNVQGTDFPWINNASSQMLSTFFSHSTGLIPNSPIFSPLENCSQQFVVPSCFPDTHSTSFAPFSMSASVEIRANL